MRKPSLTAKFGFPGSTSSLQKPHQRNADPEITSSEAGRDNNLREVQPANACSGMDFSLDPGSNVTTSRGEAEPGRNP
jgi:hypothetical protein